MIPALALSSLASQLETAVVSSRRRLLSFIPKSGHFHPRFRTTKRATKRVLCGRVQIWAARADRTITAQAFEVVAAVGSGEGAANPSGPLPTPDNNLNLSGVPDGRAEPVAN